MRVFIAGPNLRDQSKGSFHVHAEGCADIAKMKRRDPAYRDGYVIDAVDRIEVAEDVYDNGIMTAGETGRDYLFDFHFFPCCDALPTDDSEV